MSIPNNLAILKSSTTNPTSKPLTTPSTHNNLQKEVWVVLYALFPLLMVFKIVNQYKFNPIESFK